MTDTAELRSLVEAAFERRAEITPRTAPTDLRDALESIGKLRIAHQARQIERGLQPDNHVRLDELSNVERSHLKSAFGIVQGLQSVLATRYQGGRF